MTRNTVLAVKALVCGIFVLALFPVQANSARPDTRAYTCEQVVATVQQYQSMVWTTGPHTYDRIVAFRNYCRGTQVAEWKYAPTLNNPRCRIGYYCRERRFD